MKIRWLVIGFVIFSLFFLSSCGGPDKIYKGIESAKIPSDCVEFEGDLCGLFQCMLKTSGYCSCDDANFPSPVLQGGNTIVLNEEDAMKVVQDYIDKDMSDDENLVGELLEINVKRAVQLNDVFYNVFADAEGDEKVYTVAADGTIILTFCGV